MYHVKMLNLHQHQMIRIKKKTDVNNNISCQLLLFQSAHKLDILLLPNNLNCFIMFILRRQIQRYMS